MTSISNTEVRRRAVLAVAQCIEESPDWVIEPARDLSEEDRKRVAEYICEFAVQLRHSLAQMGDAPS